MYQRILLFGNRGMLALAVKRALARRALRCEGVDLEQCDITDPAAVRDAILGLKPTLLINCAAYTAVDKAEQEEALATRVNGEGPGNLAASCRETGTFLVHYSTDFVFDGTSARPYREDDPTVPQSAYARSKLAGERAIQQSGLVDWLILRTAWLYGPLGEAGGRPFPKVILENARAGKPLRVVNDQHGSPTLTFDVAEATLDLLDAKARGIFHVTNAGQTTWFGFAKAICECFRVQPLELTPITSAVCAKMRPDSARRPSSSVLDLSKLQQTIGRDMRPWDAALRDYCAITAGAP
jgi:dTDP-4-dehydrorhamnose reductase